MIQVTLHYWPQNFFERLRLLRHKAWQRSRPVMLRRELPRSWDELTPRQLRALAKANFLLHSKSARQLYLCHGFLQLPFWLFLRISRRDLFDIYRQLSDCMGENTLSRTLLRTVRCGSIHWHGPQDHGRNMSFLEFIKADTAYAAFLANHDTVHLNTLVATLYRPASQAQSRTTPGYNGDPRIPLNEYHLSGRALQAAKVPLVDRYAILLQYAGLRQYLQLRYPKTFSGGKPSRFGWAGVIVSLAGEKFGDDDAVAGKNIHAILTHLEMSLELAHKDT